MNKELLIGISIILVAAVASGLILHITDDDLTKPGDVPIEVGTYMEYTVTGMNSIDSEMPNKITMRWEIIKESSTEYYVRMSTDSVLVSENWMVKEEFIYPFGVPNAYEEGDYSHVISTKWGPVKVYSAYAEINMNVGIDDNITYEARAWVDNEEISCTLTAFAKAEVESGGDNEDPSPINLKLPNLVMCQ